MKPWWRRELITSALVLGLTASPLTTEAKDKRIPAPESDTGLAVTSEAEFIVLAGGCFWGIQAVFQHVKGGLSAISGYSGGEATSARYEAVSTGKTGHAEPVKVVFDPSQITIGQILHIFFSSYHPTELNRQGPDEGSQYRSVVFYTTEDQLRITQSYVEQLDRLGVFKHKIVTQVAPLRAFFPAEAYHQNYATQNPNDAYIWVNDAPKVMKLKRDFPLVYREPRISSQLSKDVWLSTPKQK